MEKKYFRMVETAVCYYNQYTTCTYMYMYVLFVMCIYMYTCSIHMYMYFILHISLYLCTTCTYIKIHRLRLTQNLF